MKNRAFAMMIAVIGLLPLHVFAQVKVGAARTDQYYFLLKNKTVGIVANNASVVDSRNIVDMLVKDGIQLTRIFSPEHGFRLNVEAGQQVDHSNDSITGIQVISLYGTRKKPSEDDLAGLNVILFDLQDVGVRFYTYISTLTYMMEACAENHIPLIVLDRPNPNGFYIDGPVLEKQFTSFVGMHPVPIVYGMTIGEYALMVNGEGWLSGGIKCDLKVIPVESYTHFTKYELPVKPSPNLPNMNSILLYPSLCLFEGTIVSVGRGTQYPFEVFGYPGYKNADFSFTPQSIPGMSANPPYKDQECSGVGLREFYKIHPGSSGKINLAWLIDACTDWNDKPGFFNSYFNRLAGNESLQIQISRGLSEKKIRASWKPGIEKFKKIRKKYLLY
ncbi:MAG: DUF1343 domain-containing protein [Bacteroidetes bacterium]|nr:DUF1343 domain-containing protein [Bacteroidota bacterium]